MRRQANQGETKANPTRNPQAAAGRQAERGSKAGRTAEVAVNYN